MSWEGRFILKHEPDPRITTARSAPWFFTDAERAGRALDTHTSESDGETSRFALTGRDAPPLASALERVSSVEGGNPWCTRCRVLILSSFDDER